MKYIGFLLLALMPTYSLATSCEIPKDKIDISGLFLGKSVLSLKKEHPNTLDYDLKSGDASIRFVDQMDFQDRFRGTPASSSGYINFDKTTYGITEFSVVFDRLADFKASNYKNAIIALYDLPLKNWKSDKQQRTFTYSCDNYEIEIYYAPDRSNFIVVKDR